MSHFSLKTLSFYGIAITSVVVLFNVVTAYGNANLKAPRPISGRYRIDAQNLPGCLKSDTLVLDIKQSGIYLVGSLLPAKTDARTAIVADEKPSLHGRLNNQQLRLRGTIPWIASCNNSVGQANASQDSLLVRMGAIVDEKALTGRIALSSIPTVADFTAEREAATQQPGKEH